MSFYSNSYCNTAAKMYKAAQEAKAKRDEERAYVLFMKFCNLTQQIRKAKGYAQDKVRWKLGQFHVERYTCMNGIRLMCGNCKSFCRVVQSMALTLGIGQIPKSPLIIWWH